MAPEVEFCHPKWPTAGTLLRGTNGEVVLVSRLRAALERLNPALPPEAITTAVDELTRNRSAMSLEAKNREVYRLLKEGIPVSVLERDSTSGRAELPLRPNVPGSAATPPCQKGGQTTVRVQVIDWEQPANNDFLLVNQFSVTGALYSCRPDLVGLPRADHRVWAHGGARWRGVVHISGSSKQTPNIL